MYRQQESILTISKTPRGIDASGALEGHAALNEAALRNCGESRIGRLIINADDWGRDRETTERIRECTARGTVSSVSAMVFMEDSERAAVVARESGVDAGLHLNFTTPFSSRYCSSQLMEWQRKLAAYLRGSALSKAVFHPGLVRCFDYVFAAQMDEFRRLYGSSPSRIDGHHHMHLCSNVLFGNLLPPGTITRRNFSFQPGEKSFANRLYRRLVDRKLAARHKLTDFFFSLPPLEPMSRVQHIFALAHGNVVEVETHPVHSEEYQFLMGGEIYCRLGDIRVASQYALA